MSMSQLVGWQQVPRFRDCGSSVLTRGLNAFLTDWARSQPGLEFTGGNKSFSTRNFVLSQVIRAFKGFFLSVRPGTHQLLMNINSVASPFYYLQSVHDLIRNAQRSPHSLSGILKGVKVRIRYAPNRAWPHPDSDKRFILSIGQRVNQQDCLVSQQVPGQATPPKVFTWFTAPHAQHRNHDLFPTNLAQFQLRNDSWAIEVGSDARAQPSSTEWYPAELLEIIGSQPWHGDLTGPETTRMISHAQQRPIFNARSIVTEGLRMFGLNSIVTGQNNLVSTPLTTL